MNNDLLRVFETESDYDSAKPDFVYPTVSYVKDIDEVKYMSKQLRNYLYIEALADGMTVTLNNTIQMGGMGSINAPANEFEYSTDQQVWTTLSNNIASPAINTGEKIYLRGNATSAFDKVNMILGMGYFNITQSCNIGGNIMSLLFNDDFEDKTDLTGYDGAFGSLFIGQPIVDASELILPATTLSMACYNMMFQNCTSLTAVPELPATTLADYCYGSMFRGCKLLTTVPELPATTLANSCYASMLGECTSLTTAPELPATTLTNSCYNSMFRGCKLLTTAPELPATTLTDYCYAYMFQNCTSLTTAPGLPATTLANSCYDSMFWGCESLTTAPELPATTLTNTCYNHMFHGCSNLNYIKMMATDISASNCLTVWVYGVSATGTFVKNPALSVDTIGRGISGIPLGWTVVDAE